MTLFLFHSSIYSITLSHSCSQSSSCVLHVYSRLWRGRPAICRFKFTITARTHTHTHSQRQRRNKLFEDRQTVLFGSPSLFRVFSLSLTNRWVILMKSALPVSICVRNEFHHFSKWGNSQWDRLKCRKPQRWVISLFNSSAHESKMAHFYLSDPSESLRMFTRAQLRQ